MLWVTNLKLPLPVTKLTEPACLAAMSALEARTTQALRFILEAEFIVRGQTSDLYFHGSSTATSPEVTQPQALKSISTVASARLLHQPIDTVTVMHSKRQLHQNWSRGVTSHSGVTQRHSWGVCADKASWVVFDLGHIYFGRYSTTAQHQSSLWNCADDLGWFHLWNTLHRSTEVSLFLTFLLIINSHLWLEMGNWCISLSNYKF